LLQKFAICFKSDMIQIGLNEKEKTMAISLKGTQTEKNLLIAFAGESQARNRYTFFASQAKKNGFEAISKIFLETAEHEKEHASRLFKFLEGGELEITYSFPAGKIGTTLENLQAAAYGEHEENTDMYPKFAQTAAQEGFEAVAEILKNIGYAERYHESRFRALIEAIESGTLFKQDKIVMWRCTNCGMWHIGTEAPKVCPACLHPQGYFLSEALASKCDTNEGFYEYTNID
jgi:rubrerythrin